MVREIRDLITLTPERKQEIVDAIALVEGVTHDEKCAIMISHSDVGKGGSVSWRPSKAARLCIDGKMWEFSTWGNRKVELGTKVRGEYIWKTSCALHRDTLGGRGRRDLAIPIPTWYGKTTTEALEGWLNVAVKGSATTKLTIAVNDGAGRRMEADKLPKHMQCDHTHEVGRCLQEICLWAMGKNLKNDAKPMARVAGLIRELQTYVTRLVDTDMFLGGERGLLMPTLPDGIVPKLVMWEMLERHK